MAGKTVKVAGVIILVFLVILVVLVFWGIFSNGTTESFSYRDNCPLHYSGGFLPSHQGPYFEGMPPSLHVENRYHNNMQEYCCGNYENYKCRQKSYLMAMKDGTTDKADLMCHRFRHDEDKYYECLDGIYGNYLWMDRFTGVQPCRCPDGSQGASGEYGCFCPAPRALEDRRPTDAFDRPVYTAGRD